MVKRYEFASSWNVADQSYVLASDFDDLHQRECAQIASLTAERDKLREALRGVLLTMDWDDTVERAEAIDAAREALASVPQKGGDHAD